MKIACVWTIGPTHKIIKLELTSNINLLLGFIMLEGAMHATRGEVSLSYPTVKVNLGIHYHDPQGKTCPLVQ